MIIERRDGITWADLYWDDLSADAQEKLLNLMGENGNYDLFPLTSVNVSPEEDMEEK